MAQALLKCRVCGKEYYGCRNVKHSGNFRWQNVACSPECGEIYLQQILISRGEMEPPKTKKSKKSSARSIPKEEVVVCDDVQEKG